MRNKFKAFFKFFTKINQKNSCPIKKYQKIKENIAAFKLLKMR